jgi:hypothetical protein
MCYRIPEQLLDSAGGVVNMRAVQVSKLQRRVVQGKYYISVNIYICMSICMYVYMSRTECTDHLVLTYFNYLVFPLIIYVHIICTCLYMNLISISVYIGIQAAFKGSEGDSDQYEISNEVKITPTLITPKVGSSIVVVFRRLVSFQ